jgi:hypothetical protein
VDAIKVLDTMSATGPEAAPASDRFVIQINLGADTLRFNKSIAIDANDVDPDDIDASVIATIASSKRGTDGGGQPI